jgi:alpha-methylacyl-CoA racemase
MGPLQGLRIIEIAGIGPTQFCGMLLGDLGADVLRIEREAAGDPGIAIPPEFNLMNRSRSVITADLKSDRGRAMVLRLVEEADALFEGFRPGVMERLGLGPDDCLARNPKLVYGRMTGWGQEGPLAQAAGHDANYIALAGVLGAIGERGGDPVYPLILAGDLGGGGLYLALGLLAALLETSRSGRGQVVDAAIVDGAANLMTLFHGLLAAGLWRDRRGSNVLDGGAPFARSYRTRDGKHVVIQPLENRFFRQLLERMDIGDIDADRQYDPSYWPEIEKRLAEVFASRSREEWCELLEGRDVCFAPVLSLTEVAEHPHLAARKTHREVDGIMQPGPAPRFSRTEAEIGCSPANPLDPEPLLKRWGFSGPEIDHWRPRTRAG